MKKFIKTAFLVLTIVSAANFASAQSKARKKNSKAKTPNTIEAPAQLPEETVEITPGKTPVKKNERPETVDGSQIPQKKNRNEKTSAPELAEARSAYVYEFSQPSFIVKSIVIEHDESGKGKITFEKKDFEEPISDPLQLSPGTLERIRNSYATLNFLDSTEVYQSPSRDYKHLGTVKISRLEGGKNRTAEFNWTENQAAKSLADEYRKIANQSVWMFDITVARDNQPLEAPGLMDALSALVKRNEIADPAQMIPFLRELGNDERIPLMARNRAAKIIKEIEKKAEK